MKFIPKKQTGGLVGRYLQEHQYSLKAPITNAAPVAAAIPAATQITLPTAASVNNVPIDFNQPNAIQNYLQALTDKWTSGKTSQTPTAWRMPINAAPPAITPAPAVAIANPTANPAAKKVITKPTDAGMGKVSTRVPYPNEAFDYMHAPHAQAPAKTKEVPGAKSSVYNPVTGETLQSRNTPQAKEEKSWLNPSGNYPKGSGQAKPAAKVAPKKESKLVDHKPAAKQPEKSNLVARPKAAAGAVDKITISTKQMQEYANMPEYAWASLKSLTPTDLKLIKKTKYGK